MNDAEKTNVVGDAEDTTLETFGYQPGMLVPALHLAFTDTKS
jgi:hypothetical protein